MCIVIIAQTVSELRKGQGHVSFRQSRLTMLLRDALGGNSKTVLIVCALQEHDSLDETISTLRFAQRVKDLKTIAVVNKVVDSVQAEREQRKLELKSKVEAFLSQEEDVDAIPIESLAQIKETYYIFKEAQSMLHAKLEKLSKESSISKIEENETTEMMKEEDGVGELEPQGISVGIAPLHWRPAKMDMENTNASSANLQQSLNKSRSSYEVDSRKRNLAFQQFKHTISEGIQQCYILNCKKSELKLQEAKAEYQKCFAELLQLKAQIQSVRKEIVECQEGLLDSFFKWYKRERDTQHFQDVKH